LDLNPVICLQKPACGLNRDIRPSQIWYPGIKPGFQRIVVPKNVRKRKGREDLILYSQHLIPKQTEVEEKINLILCAFIAHAPIHQISCVRDRMELNASLN